MPGINKGQAYAIFFACVLFLPSLSSAGDGVDIVSMDEGGLVLSYRPVPGTIDSVAVNGRTYCRFTYEGHSPENPSGAPAVPTSSIFFAAPAGVTPTVETTVLSEREISGILLLPVPEIEKDGSGVYVETYREDPAYYALSGYRPDSHAFLGGKVGKGGIDIWELVLSPVLYDAHASRAAVADSIRVHITFAGTRIASHMLPKRVPDYIANGKVLRRLAVRKPVSAVYDPFGTGDWYRITIGKSGMYGITGAELAKAGFPVGTVGTDEIRMYYGGGMLIDPEDYDHDEKLDFKEIAVKIVDSAGDGVFDSDDVVVFYGEALSRFYTKPGRQRLYYQNHLYSDENVYWLRISGDGFPVRIKPTGEPPAGGTEAVTTYRFTKHIEHDYHLELEGGGTEWYWEAIMLNYKQIPFSAPGVVPGKKSIFRVGVLNQHEPRAHLVVIYVNGEKAEDYYFSERKGFVTHETTVELKPKDNMISLVRKYQHGEADASFRLDWVEIEYERRLEYTQNHFEFFYAGDGTSMKFTVADVKKSTVEVYDTTNPYRVKEFTQTEHDGERDTLTFQGVLPKDRPSRFILHDPASYLKVSSITRKKGFGLRNPSNDANYILITNRLFMEEARRLAAWRERDSRIEPLTPMVVDVDDIFDEFNWGVYDPLAIRRFLRFVWENGNPDKRYYCCILGDTTFKYKNLSESQVGKNLVPTYTGYDNDRYALTNDDYFCWFDRNHFPAFAMGRLCAPDRETAKVLVDKTIDYEKNPVGGPWHNRVLLIADDDLKDNGVGQETIHTVDTESLDDHRFIPPSVERVKIMMVEYPLKNFRKPDVTEAIFKTLDEGCVIMNFIGHGNDDLLAHEHILVGTRDIERFNNGGKLPLFLVFSCTVGNFIQLDNLSLAEMLHLRKGGGVIGTIAATNKTFSNPNIELNKRFFVNQFDRDANPEYRIGYALYRAKHDTHKLNSNRYMLFGDPATRLMLPRLDISVAPVDTVYRLQRVRLSGTFEDGGKPVPFEGTLYVRARGPKIHKTYNTNNNVFTINYTQPGKTFYYGETAVNGNDFETAFVVPKDLPSSTGETYIYFFATGPGGEASGVLHDFVIGGLDRSAPEDKTGPEIKFAFDGKNFDDGDYISRQPGMRATITDPSGINIYGNRGHNITLVIDKKEIVVLTDRFKTINGYTTGVLDYTLPILSPGEHTLELNVYDTYNNAAKKSVTAYVVGSETGDIAIMDLLNYPNPMGADGTTFTFSLTDDAQYADISIYSQSGRLVDRLKFPADYGFNMVKWKPPFAIANGVYFYKLTVRSVNGRKSSKIEKLVVMK